MLKAGTPKEAILNRTDCNVGGLISVSAAVGPSNMPQPAMSGTGLIRAGYKSLDRRVITLGV